MSDKFYIYAITNVKNGKMYIGKSVCPKLRWADHKKVALGGKEKYPDDFSAVHAALAKYGVDNFTYEIIDEYDDENESYLAETAMILLMCSNKKDYGYNCNLGGRGGIKPTEETMRKLIAAQNKPEKIAISSDLMKKRHQENPGFLSSVHKGNKYTLGRKLSIERKQQISKQFKGKKLSEDHKKKMSESSTRGEDKHSSKLTNEKVLEIRKKYKPYEYGYIKLSKEYNVDDETIRKIILRKTWKHI
jgi:group I intron endonuclease